MTATVAEALELALWLHRAPARRAALLGRPLPDGIGQLLRVASGARDPVASAATVMGVSEATILEAVRFYVQQILFHEDADAYRVLGLHHDDTQERAREHHRLLQQWLHPDRAGQDAWESVYAIRINRAWSQLRSPQGRAAYDASIAPSAMSEVGVPVGNRQASDYPDPVRTVSAPVARRSPTRSRNLTLGVLLGCAGLLVTIALRQEAPPEWVENRPPVVDAATPGVADFVPFSTISAASVDAVDVGVPTPPLPHSGDAQEAPAIVTTTDVASVPFDAPPTVPSKASRVDRMTIAQPEALPERLARPVQSVPAAATPTAVVPREPTVQAVAQLMDASAARAAPAAPATEVPGLAGEGTVPVVQVPDAFSRMEQAQARTTAVLGYLRDAGPGLPPVWNDVRTMQAAVRIRTALQVRQGRRRVPVELQAPHWRLSPEGAHLESRYRAGAEQGRLDLAFIWRENQLLVSGISLDPDA